MKLDFDFLDKIKIENFKGGIGELYLKKFEDQFVKIMQSVLTVGSTIGAHTHTEDSEIIYVLSGEGLAECDGREELLSKGKVHYCPKNSTHTIKNTGDADLVMYAIVIKKL